uniref:Transcription factor 25 n=1 Tax=Setaria digitata TaxID=48799 RepID=A0A915Q5I6_9BILA
MNAKTRLEETVQIGLFGTGHACIYGYIVIMSTKHLRRYLQEKKLAGVEKSPDEKDEESFQSADKAKSDTFVCNRYEFLEESGEGEDESSGPVEEAPLERRPEKKTVKKKKKGKKKVHCTDTNNDLEDLDNLPNEALIRKDRDLVFEKDLFKVDSRMLNVESELRSILGRRSTDTSQRGRTVFGKIVKKKPTWPEIKNVGLSMELDCIEDDIFWFKFSHHAFYRELQQTFWIASESLDHNLISNILAHCPYHLDSLLIMAELLRQQEDYQFSRDLIERGLFCCESVFAPRFQLSNFNHRIDYVNFENRAFYLLLHRHLRNLIDRHCFKTALHVARLIYRLDPVSDPLAIMLTIDSVALKAREYNYLILLYNTLKDSKNLDRLPNFAYSIALAYFFLFCENGRVEDKEIADLMIASAIRHFPTVLLKLLDAMNVQPDPAIENNQYMSIVAHERESEGIKLLTSIYLKLSSSIWLEDPSVLPWLEGITTATVSSFNNFKEELTKWEKLRKTCYVGIPRNIERHAYLWEVTRNAEWILSDPAPPYNGRMMYTRIVDTPRPDSFLSGLLHSVWPDYDQGQHLNASIEELLNVLRGMFVSEASATNDGDLDGSNREENNREAVNEVNNGGVEEGAMQQEHRADGDDDAQAGFAGMR